MSIVKIKTLCFQRQDYYCILYRFYVPQVKINCTGSNLKNVIPNPLFFFHRKHSLQMTSRCVCSVLLNRRWLCRSQAGVQQMVSESVNTSVWTDGLAKVRPVILLALKSHHTKRSSSCNGTWWINWDFCGFIIPLSKSLHVHCVKTNFHC
jgi:hypothetical protein